jgi:hypothetical protein
MSTAAAPATASSALPAVVPLHGDWRRSVGGRALDFVPVPGTFPPCGECQLDFELELPEGWDAGARCFLVTEGVLSEADFAINGRALGTAGPWVTTRFELPRGTLTKANRITATIRDITAHFGPMAGRRYDAGLQRPVRLERRPATFIASVGFQTVLSDDLRAARVAVAVEQDGPAQALEVVLAERGGEVVFRGAFRAGETPAFTVDRPRLWSPQRPELYELTVTLANGDRVIDSVGFRKLEARGRDFWLNGERLLLKGVCRHEFISGFGYAPPEAEVRRDLGLIKTAGFNYVRLVHSPQASCVPRIASELGLLVSEEMGLCHDDLSKPEKSDASARTLESIVRRDRTQPSIFAWFIYNECDPVVAYAKRAAEICRRLDPGRLIGFADCSGRDDELKTMVKEADLSFYGVNMYTTWIPEFHRRTGVLADKPLVLTEWGGWGVQGAAECLTMVCETIASLAREDAATRFAGHSFWAWADYEEYRRDHIGNPKGWTQEGLLDDRLRPKPDLVIINRMNWEMDHPTPARPARVEIPLRLPAQEGWSCVDLARVAPDDGEPERALARMRAKYRGVWPQLGRALIGGIEFAARNRDGSARPLLLGAGREELVIPVGRAAREIAIVGHTAFASAYPGNAQFSVNHPGTEEPIRARGDLAAEYVFVFDDGEQVQPLRHGLEVLRANELCRWWRTDALSPETLTAFRATVHPTYEIVRAELWRKRWEKPRTLREIRWRLKDAQAILTLFAVSVLA